MAHSQKPNAVTKVIPFQADVLTEASLVFENLNSRSLCAIVAMAATALKFSAFMVEKEEEILMTWSVFIVSFLVT